MRRVQRWQLCIRNRRFLQLRTLESSPSDLTCFEALLDTHTSAPGGVVGLIGASSSVNMRGAEVFPTPCLIQSNGAPPFATTGVWPERGGGGEAIVHAGGAVLGTVVGSSTGGAILCGSLGGGDLTSTCGGGAFAVAPGALIVEQGHRFGPIRKPQKTQESIAFTRKRLGGRCCQNVSLSLSLTACSSPPSS